MIEKEGTRPGAGDSSSSREWKSTLEVLMITLQSEMGREIGQGERGKQREMRDEMV